MRSSSGGLSNKDCRAEGCVLSNPPSTHTSSNCINTSPGTQKSRAVHSTGRTPSFTMLAHLKLVLLCAVLLGLMTLDVVVAARQLLDDYDNCHNGWCAAVRTVL